MKRIQIALTAAGFVLALGFWAQPAADAATVLTVSDGVIRNSLCTGFDCPNNPSFSDSTILLVENNTRIKFDDTSTASSFPRNDWELQANSSTNGGGDFFAINDCGQTSGGGCADDPLLKIEAGAPANSIYVDSSGRVGFGKSNPVLELHVVDGDSPGLRLEQDGSSGFTPQTWDLAGNETNLFVRDVTNGSRLPFRIRPNTPTNTLMMTADDSGRIGMGTASPEQALHVRRTDATAQILVEEASATTAQRTLLRLRNNGQARMIFNDTATGANWFNGSAGGGDYVMDDTVVGGTAARLTQSGDLTLNGTITVTGGCTGCDLVFSEGYPIESIEDHAEYMWSNMHLPGVGPTPEDQPMNLAFKTGGILNELEKAHIYIEQLHQRLATIEAELAERESTE